MYIKIVLEHKGELSEDPFLIHEDDFKECMELVQEWKKERLPEDWLFSEFEDFANEKGLQTIRHYDEEVLKV